VTELAVLQDLRRDAEDCLRTEIALHILDLALEDIPTQEEIHMLKDFDDEERWTGIYQVETNMEKLYEVSYSYTAGKFYITTYTVRNQNE
jgi:hypothetical protein